MKEITEDIEKYNHECKTYWEIIEILLKKTNQTSSDMQQWETISWRKDRQSIKITTKAALKLALPCQKQILTWWKLEKQQKKREK